MARRSQVVRTVAHSESCLRGDENLVAAASDRFAQDFFGRALRVDVSGVEKIKTGFQADIHEASGFLHVGGAPGSEEISAAAEGAAAEAEDGNF